MSELFQFVGVVAGDICVGDTSQRTSFAQSWSVYVVTVDIIDFRFSEAFLRRMLPPLPLFVDMDELREFDWPFSDVAGVVTRVEVEGAEVEKDVGQLASDALPSCEADDEPTEYEDDARRDGCSGLVLPLPLITPLLAVLLTTSWWRSSSLLGSA